MPNKITVIISLHLDVDFLKKIRFSHGWSLHQKISFLVCPMISEKNHNGSCQKEPFFNETVKQK